MTTVRNILKKVGFQPLKRLGQNFLTDKNAVKKIIEAAEIEPTDIILEIGPGTGVLTQKLARRAKKVIAIEKDPKMVEILKEVLKNYNNVKVIQDDILKIFNFQLPSEAKPSSTGDETKSQRPSIFNYKVVANLPFYLITPAIRKLLEAPVQPKLMVLVVQKEVAQRICANVPDMNLLAVSVQFYAEPKIISYISKKSFWPQPKVDGAIIKITLHSHSLKMSDRTLLEKRKNKDLFFRVVRAGFSQPRKQLINNLSKSLKVDKIKVEKWLLKNNIQPNQRAETLDIKDWLKLTKTYQLFDC